MNSSTWWKIRKEVDAWWNKRSKNVPCGRCGVRERTHPERSEQWAKIEEVVEKYLKPKKERKK